MELGLCVCVCVHECGLVFGEGWRLSLGPWMAEEGAGACWGCTEDRLFETLWDLGSMCVCVCVAHACPEGHAKLGGHCLLKDSAELEPCLCVWGERRGHRRWCHLSGCCGSLCEATCVSVSV